MLIRATQQMIKEEENRIPLLKSSSDAPLWPANRLPKGHGPCFTPEYAHLPLQTVACRRLSQVISPVPSPTPLSRLSSPASEQLQEPKDYFQTYRPPLSLPLHHPLSRSAPLSTSPTPAPALYLSNTHPQPYLDKHAAYSVTGYALEHLYEPESIQGCCTSASNSPNRYNFTPHLHIPTEQTPTHKGTAVIMTNSS